MSVIQTKSISGITSITTPSGSDNLLTIHTSDTTERVRVNSLGDVIVGTGVTLSPDGDVYTTGVTTATTFIGALTGNVTGNVSGNVTGNVTGTSSKVTITSGADNRIVTAAGADTLQGETNVVVNGGILIAGHTASTTCSDGEGPFFQAKSTDSRAGASFIRHSADASGGGVYIAKSRNATIGSNTVVQSGDELGRITFSGDDGTDINTPAAKIASYVDGTPGSNDMPGRLQFYTTADGAAAASVRLTIKADGKVGINEVAPTTNLNVSGGFHISGTADQTKAQDGLLLQRNTSSGNCEIVAGRAGGNYSGLQLYVAGASGVTKRHQIDYQSNHAWYGANGTTELMELQSDGDLKLGSGNLIVDTAGKGILFSAHNDPNNLLDDYEEGTFTLSVNLVNESYTAQTGFYTKVGHLVTWNARLHWTGGNGTSDQILGLPFTVKNLDYTNSMTTNIYSNSGLDVGSHDYLCAYHAQGHSRLNMTFQTTTTQYNLPGSANIYMSGFYYTAS